MGLTICRPSSPIKWFVVCNFLFSYCFWILDLIRDILGSSRLPKNYPIYRPKIIVDINSDKVVSKEFLLPPIPPYIVPRWFRGGGGPFRMLIILLVFFTSTRNRAPWTPAREITNSPQAWKHSGPTQYFSTLVFCWDSGMFKFRKHQGAPQSLEHFCF